MHGIGLCILLMLQFRYAVPVPFAAHGWTALSIQII